jgi:hypothetical protein
MKKICTIFIIVTFLSILSGGLALDALDDFDNLKRSFKDLERSMKQDSLKDAQIQKEYQLPQPQTQSIPADTNLISPGQLQPYVGSKDKPADDRAILENQERLKELMDEGEKNQSASIEDEGFRISERYRSIVDIVAISICVILVGLVLYIRKVKEEQRAKISGGDSSQY